MDRKPGGNDNPLKKLFGRKTGIDLDETLPDFDGPEPEEPPARAPKAPKGGKDTLDWPNAAPGPTAPASNAPPPAAPPAPAPGRAAGAPGGPTPGQTRPLPPRSPARPDAAPSRPLPHDPYSDNEFDFLRDDDPLPRPQPDDAPKPEDRPSPRQTSRLDARDMDIGNTTSGSDDSGAKYRSDRARWW